MEAMEEIRACASCQEAFTWRPPLPLPARWVRLDDALDNAGHWAWSVHRCLDCGTLWDTEFHKHEEVFVGIELLDPRLLSVLQADAPFEDAWAARHEARKARGGWHYLRVYAASAHYDVPSALTTLSQALEAQGDDAADAVEFLTALLENHAAEGVSVDAPRLRRLAQGAVADAPDLLKRLEESLRLQAARHASFRIPRPQPPPPPRVERVPPGRPGFLPALQATGLLRFGGYRAFLPAIALVSGFCELFRAARPGDFLPAVAFMLPIFTGLYSGAAAFLSRRWPGKGPVALGFERWPGGFSIYLFYPAILALGVMLGGLDRLLLPEDRVVGWVENIAGALVCAAVPLWRLWPIFAASFVYRGRRSNSRFQTQGYTWNGPFFRAAWRITSQPGFGRRITLPLFVTVGLAVLALGALHEASPLLTRVLVYAVVAPLGATLVDLLTDGWRVKTGDQRWDR